VCDHYILVQIVFVSGKKSVRDDLGDIRGTHYRAMTRAGGDRERRRSDRSR
jgi:hypothetical protein